ncbi:MAG: hypothetical protein KJ720_17695 [Proteobacteria bacterium]|nr:hypothetical protein [Pseudomonadota bacterium]MBU1451033.1 hypothetical protein [Pseudomonadota bacterium]MBU2467842.1 hypothetical protein [Pseudomonadota bacterium]
MRKLKQIAVIARSGGQGAGNEKEAAPAATWRSSFSLVMPPVTSDFSLPNKEEARESEDGHGPPQGAVHFQQPPWAASLAMTAIAVKKSAAKQYLLPRMPTRQI